MPVEEDVGITAYANTAPGFAATLKHRYSDFKVNEIRVDGSEVVLVDTGLPAACTGTEDEDRPALSPEDLVSQFEKEAQTAAPPELLAFLQKASEGQASRTERIALGSFSDKAQRTAVHSIFKAWPSVATETDSNGIIQLGLGGGKQGIKRRRSAWPGGDFKYVRFTLYKENMDTQATLSAIGRKLGLSPKVFGIAGTKDKRACTTQEVTAFRVDPARLQGAAAHLPGGLVRLGDFQFTNDELHLGQLGGNRFGLVLRQVPPEKQDDIDSACRALASSGFINYFGLQRFGSGSVPTHQVGRTLIAGNWSEAVRLILQQNGPQAEVPSTLEEATGALRRCASWAVAEKHILQALSKHGLTNHLTALQAIPKNLRLMYIHAYQSYLWNAAASARFKLSSTAVLAGDLVAIVDSDKADESAPEEVEDDGTRDLPAKMSVHVVTEEEAAAGAYTLFDVVLPLPGSSVQMPENEVAVVYSSIAQADGIDLEETRHGCAEFSLAGQMGGYRSLLARPEELEWGFLRYADPNAPLKWEEQGPGNGPLAALRLEFTLRPSMYATMLVRELTKQPAAQLHAAPGKSQS